MHCWRGPYRRVAAGRAGLTATRPGLMHQSHLSEPMHMPGMADYLGDGGYTAGVFHMMSAGPLGIPMNRMGSGTSWLPTTSMHASA